MPARAAINDSFAEEEQQPQAVTYSAAGVPSHVLGLGYHDVYKVAHHQRHVKCWSKCMTYFGYVAHFVGAIVIMAQMFDVFFSDEKVAVTFYTKEKKLKSINFH